MKEIYQEILDNKNVRGNLSALRQIAKQQAEEVAELVNLAPEKIMRLLQDEDAKTRKNAALLLGDAACEKAVDALFEAYEKEETLFVRSAYLIALSHLPVESKVPQLKTQLETLLQSNPTEENKKHVEEEIRAIRKILIQQEGITTHTFDAKGKTANVILLVNRNLREVVRRSISCGQAWLHPLGVKVETDDFLSLLQLRTYREILWPIKINGQPEDTLISGRPDELAEQLWNSNLYQLLLQFHKEEGPFYFRVECKSAMELEKRSAFTKKLSMALEHCSKGQLVNSTSDYEIELRLIANKNGEFFPTLKFCTIKNKRFAYRKNFIASSIHPSTAALIMEVAEPYLKENAQVMDPFCGVGTMLIERDIKVPAKQMYATDIFGEAIEKGRENARLAGERINFIHRDYFDFKHEYKFDEIITNMPPRGKKTKEECDAFYTRFFQKSTEVLQDDAIIIMYTNEVGFVKKQLRLHKEYHLLQETCMQTKTEYYLLIIGYKG